jgi:hypothetical protein
MCLKNKIIAAALCALVAGIGIFAANGNVVRANMPHTNLPEDNETITLLLQQIESLKQQIQQLIQQIAYWKPLETCGNGKCRFGETAAICPADCGNIGNCVSEGKPFSNYESSKQCCDGLTKAKYLEPGTMCSGSAACYTGYVCTNCGNGKCETGETATSCPTDCDPTISDKGKIKCSATGGVWKYNNCTSGCVYNTKNERLVGGKVCPEMCIKDYSCNCVAGKFWGSREEGCVTNLLCGDGRCQYNETAATCPADCGDCVIGIKTDSCCACPDRIARSLVGTNNWVIYESGKNYSSLPKTENCQNILCSACNPNPSCNN